MKSNASFFLFLIIFTSICVNKTVMADNPVTHETMTLFLAGDVMTGRGIDQVLPHSADPKLYEPYVKDARDYVRLAESVNGPIQKPVPCDYIWGDALEVLARLAPDVRLINLETSITHSNEPWPNKGIHYKMHPENVVCLNAADIDFCSLANNHVLDWGYPGLIETFNSLEGANIKFAGAGENLQAAEQPAILNIKGKGKIIMFSIGFSSSGIPSSWAAKKDRPGVNLLRSFSSWNVRDIKKQIDAIKQAGDIVVASVHWGSNWGYEVPERHINFAHRLIDDAGVDMVFGHSSHHPRPFEIYKDKLIVYGSGDFLNDYEGISGYEAFRDDLVLMYFASIHTESGKLAELQMVPMQIKNFKLNRVSENDVAWLQEMFNREGKVFDTRVEINEDHVLKIQ